MFGLLFVFKFSLVIRNLVRRSGLGGVGEGVGEWRVEGGRGEGRSSYYFCVIYR